MSREIKFRAWNTEAKYMVQDPTSMGSIMRDHVRKALDLNGKLIGGNYEPMQYTGLKDKNGNEIHDAFIVKQFDDICLIERCIGGFDCKMIGGPHKGSTFIFSYLSEGYCEIIGNKWENPELLEVTK